MRKLILFCIFGFVGSLFAQSAYYGYGAGLQFNVGDLGATITKDGLDNGAGDQKIIIPENTIDVWAKSGFVTRTTKSAMHGLILNLFYEKESTGTFWRVGIDYTRKILGGKTKAQLAGYTLVDQNWDFNSLYIPLLYGIKAGVGESSSVYGAIGINYFRGGWSLSGTVDGATPCYVGLTLGTYNLCSFGPWGDQTTRIRVQTSREIGLPTTAVLATTPIDKFYQGAIFGEQIVFDVHGIGYNLLVGFETKMQNNSKFYIELEYLVAGGMDNAPVRSSGTVNQLAPTGYISYPINLSGMRWKVGIKNPL
ncbi:MAG: porin OmpL1 [Leptonema sp. (in: bacteria)]